MKRALPNYVTFPLVSAVVGTLIFAFVPIIGVALLLPFLPLVELYNNFIPGNFTETSDHVEIGSAWIILKTPQAWMFYASFFFLVGLAVERLHRVTKGKMVPFIVSLVVVYALAASLQSSVSERDYNQERLEAVTATEVVFQCSEFSSLKVSAEGLVTRFTQSGTARSQSFLGHVDFASSTFSARKSGYMKNESSQEIFERLKTDLSSCLNSNEDAISDLYEIDLSHFFREEAIQ